MNKTVEDIQNDLIQTIGERAEQFGFARIAGQLEGLLFLAPEPLSLDDMADKLEVSKASVSTNIRLLERWKVVKKVYHKGDRKNLYQFRGSIWEIETEIAKTIVKDEIDRFKSLITHSMDDLSSVKSRSKDVKTQVEFLRQRFEEIREYVEAGEHVLNLLLRKGDITPAVVKKIKIS